MELGATVCTPRNPGCGLCPWKKDCAAHRLGIAAELPRRAEKREKPVRYGRVFWIYKKDGRFLIHKREDKGLYGGMYQLPTGAWLDKKPETPPEFGGTKPYDVTVRHSFTHFDLVLEIWGGPAGRKNPVAGGVWAGAEDIDAYALPSLMKKAIRLCLSRRL
jgi:A/G-specific adenine glycosylase